MVHQVGNPPCHCATPYPYAQGAPLVVRDAVNGNTAPLQPNTWVGPHQIIEDPAEGRSRRFWLGMKVTGAICGTALAAIALGWIIDEVWYRNRLMGCGMYGGLYGNGLYGGFL